MESELDNGSDAGPLMMTTDKAAKGLIINNNIFLTEQQYNTLVTVDANTVQCSVCRAPCKIEQYPEHIRREDHKRNMMQHPPLEKYDLSIVRKVHNNHHCGVCNVLFDPQGTDDHLATEPHQNNLLMAINKVIDITYDRDSCTGRDKDCYHFNAMLINNENFRENEISEDPDNNYWLEKKLDEEYENEFKDEHVLKVEEEVSEQFSYVMAARKPKTLPKYMEVEVEGRRLKVLFNSWHMMLVMKPNRFYCMVCRSSGHVGLLPDHCTKVGHKSKLESCSVVVKYDHHLIRKVDERLYHCAHCNNLQLISDIDDHIECSHPIVRNRNITEDSVPINSMEKNARFIGNGKTVTKSTNTATNTSKTVTKPGNTVARPGSSVTKHGSTDTRSDNTAARPGSSVTKHGSTDTRSDNTAARPGSSVTKHDSTDTRSDNTVAKPGSSVTKHGNADTRSDNTAARPGSSVTKHGSTDTRSDNTAARPGSSVTKHDSTDTRSDNTVAKPGSSVTKHGNADTRSDNTAARPGSSVTKHGNADTRSDNTAARPGSSVTKHGSTDTRSDNTVVRPGSSVTKHGNTDTTNIFGRVEREIMELHIFSAKITLSTLSYNTLVYDDHHYCCVCELTVNTEDLSEHVRTVSHIEHMNLTPFMNEFGINLIRMMRKCLHCAVCNVVVKHSSIYKHVKEPVHLGYLHKAVNAQVETNIIGDRVEKPSTSKEVTGVDNNNQFSVLNQILDEAENNLEVLRNVDTNNGNDTANIEGRVEAETDVNTDTLQEGIETEVDTDQEEFMYIEELVLKKKKLYYKISVIAYNALVAVGDGTRYCALCSAMVKCDLKKHAESRFHTDNIHKYKFLENYQKDLLRQIFHTYHCAHCNVTFTRRQIKAHLSWPTHLQRISSRKLEKSRKETGNAMKEINLVYQKERLYTTEVAPQIKIGARYQFTGKPEGASHKHKLILCNGNALKISWHSWNSFVRSETGLKCCLCKMELSGEELTWHSTNADHLKKLEKNLLMEHLPALMRKVNDDTLNCVTCNTEVANNTLTIMDHIEGKKHERNFKNVLESSGAGSYEDCDQEVLTIP